MGPPELNVLLHDYKNSQLYHSHPQRFLQHRLPHLLLRHVYLRYLAPLQFRLQSRLLAPESHSPSSIRRSHLLRRTLPRKLHQEYAVLRGKEQQLLLRERGDEHD